MPMPKPRRGEKESEFVSRFMADEAMREEYPTQKQRLAIAYDVYRRHRSGYKHSWHK